MRKALAACLFLAGACNPAPAKDAPPAPAKATETATASSTASHVASTPPDAAAAMSKLVVLPADADTDALSLIRTKRLEAKAAGRVLVVFVAATWCEPCKTMKAEIEAGRLDGRYGRLTLLAFDVDRDGDRLGAAGYTYRFVPFVALPGADGHPADTQQATGKGGGAWRELLGKLDSWQASAS